MKIAGRVVGVIVIGSSLTLATSALARGGFHGGEGFRGGGSHSSGSWSHNGGSHSGFHGRFHEGFRGGFYGPGIAFGVWPSYYYYPPYYDYSDFGPTYDYAQPPVVYDSPPVNYEPQQSTQTPAPNAATQTAQPNVQKQAMTVGEIKALAKGGLSDDAIISKIRNSQAVFHLTTAEVFDLKNSGVSEKVINIMLSTANQR